MPSNTSINTATESVGIFAVFNQAGGTNNAGRLGLTATYNLLGTNATLNAGSEMIDQVPLKPGVTSAGVFNQSDGTNNISASLSGGSGTLALGGPAPLNNGLYNLSGGTLSANAEIVGGLSTGKIDQTGGTNTITSSIFGGNGTLTLGAQPGGDGTYHLANGGLSAVNEIVGASGNGTFNHDSGTNSTGDLTVGAMAGSSGTYNLTGGSLTISSKLGIATDIIVGDSGLGVFNQSGGTAFSSNLWIGRQAGSNGSYFQTGGTTTLTNLEIAVDPNCLLPGCTAGNGSYTLSGTAALTATTETVGGNGNGVFNQDGGSNTVTAGMSVGGVNTLSPNGHGVYNLSGGTLSATNVLQVFSNSTFNQSGGTSVLGSLSVQGGVYNLTSGSLSAGSIHNGQFSSSGTFNYSGGTLTGNFVNEGSATFNIMGPGIRTVNGSLTITGGMVVVTASEAQFFGGVTLTAGVYTADPSTSLFQNFNVGGAGYVTGVTGDVFQISKDFQDLSTQNTLWNTGTSQLDFTGGGVHTFSLAGLSGAGFNNNFGWGTVSILPGNTLDLAKGSGNALYVNSLLGLAISGNLITNINGVSGLSIFYNAADNPFLHGSYNLTGGGQLIPFGGVAPTPEPSTWMLMAGGLGSLAARRARRRNRKALTRS